MSIADVGAIVGIGETAYTRGSGKSATALQMEAALVAIADAGITPRDIDGIVTCSTGPVVAEDFVTNFGIPDLRLSAHVRMGGASCVAALQTAVAAIAVGSCRYVLIPVGRNGYSEVRTDARMKEMPQLDVVAEFEGPVGSLAPVQYYAVMARRHMELYGTTSRQLGRIAVASRRHAALNPRALMTLWLLKGAVLLLGLLVAWWMSLALLGPPSRGQIRPPSARPSGQPVPAISAPSGASQPLPPASKPVLTAGLAR